MPLFDSPNGNDGTQVWLPGQGELWHGGSWTADISECPNDGGVCTRPSLSEILVTIGPDEPYWLSPKACQGILRRASRRGKTLPEALQAALESRALREP
jgi:streptogramin lyase